MRRPPHAPRPPRAAERLLSLFLRGTRAHEAILGDLTEEHLARAGRRGRLFAAGWYWREAAGIAARFALLALRRDRARARPPHPPPLPGDPFMSELWRDVRLALRSLAHRRGFTAVVVVTLAVGLAANATVLAVLDGLVLRPFPLRDIDRLVEAFSVAPQGGFMSDRARVSPADFQDWQREARSADALVALEWWDATITGGIEPERVQAYRVSPPFFTTLGTGVARGRGFLPEEGEAGRNRVAVVGYGLWERRYARDPAIVGRTIQLDGEPHVVVGIAPPRFDYPVGSEVWTPLAFTAEDLRHRERRSVSVIGRLRDGRTAGHLQAELSTVARRLAETYPSTNRGWSANVMPLADAVIDIGVGPFLAVWQASAFLILLMACVNVANLLLARGTDRRKELALRVALGANRWRVVRLLVTESVVMALGGALLAIPLAWAALHVTRTSMPASIARFVRGWDQIDVDFRLVAALAALGIASALIFGLIPALRASRVSLTDALKEGGRAGTAGRQRLRNAMVVVEIALALTLLVAAGLSIRGALHVLTRDDGYDPQGVMTMRITLPERAYPDAERRRAFFEQLVQSARGLAGVESAGVVNIVPSHGGNMGRRFEIEGRPPLDPAERPAADYRMVTPGYVDALRLRLEGGRWFDARDGAGTLPVAIVSRTMADRYWPGEDPIGQRFRRSGDGQPWMTIVGVAADVRHSWFRNELYPTFYVPFAQDPSGDMVLVMRTAGDPAPLARAGREAVTRLDPQQAVYEVRSMREIRSQRAIGLMYAASFMAGFGAIGLLLAAVGVYGIMAYAVGQRTHEIGVRMALGASRRDVLISTVGQGLVLTAAGLAAGLAGAYLLGAFMENALFGSVRLDFATFVVFPLVLGAVAAGAAFVPARRALKVDPMVALRAE